MTGSRKLNLGFYDSLDSISSDFFDIPYFIPTAFAILKRNRCSISAAFQREDLIRAVRRVVVDAMIRRWSKHQHQVHLNSRYESGMILICHSSARLYART